MNATFYDFCHHCGASIGQNQVAGQTLVCKACGQTIGVVAAPQPKVMIDATEEAIRSGAAARCALCSQAVQVKQSGGVRSYVPHFVAGGQRKMCPNSGKPVPSEQSPPLSRYSGRGVGGEGSEAPARSLVMSSGKDLSAFMNRELIRVIACRRDAEPTIEQLTLEYLDKNDRIRLQIDALRDILGPKFQIKVYPPGLKRPELGMWVTPEMIVIARKHPQGGYQPMSDTELRQALDEIRQHKATFWAA